MTQDPGGRRIRSALLSRGSWAETSRISEILRKETVGGIILLIAAGTALVWANSPWAGSYFSLRDLRVGAEPFGLHLTLTLGTWAADGLLAVFFFVVGLELKREFVAGDLRDPRRAALPIAAAVGGMVVPALVFVAVTARVGDGAARGWAIPTATDIAFAVAVLAVISTHLPSALRTFLLTLAVVDDLLAITVIAVFYTEDINIVALAAALVPLAVFTLCVQRGVQAWWLLIPLAVAAWALMHESGVHATVAGVLLGFAVPVRRSATRRGVDRGHQVGMAEHFEHLHAAGLGGNRDTGVRILRGGRQPGWRQRAGAGLHRPDHPGHRARPGRGQTRRDSAHHAGAGRGDTGRSRRRTAVDRRGGHFDACRDRLHGVPADR